MLAAVIILVAFGLMLAALNNAQEQLRRTQHENRVLKRFLGKHLKEARERNRGEDHE
jgi:hypothetical protein